MNKIIRPVGTATYQDIIDAPENMVAEIIYGALHTQHRPAPKHALAGSSLGMEIGMPFHKGRGGPGGWWILQEPEVQFGTDVLVPDIAGWRRERMPGMPETNTFEVIPDWVTEVLSPSTRQRDLVDKREIYAAFGVGHIWFIDPEARTLEAYANHGGELTLIATLKDDDPVKVAPFETHTFGLGEMWY